MSDNSDVIAVIQAGDIESLRILLAEDSARASARDEAGISATMHALYRRRQDMVDLLLAAGHGLDIFEAASLGRVQRAGELLDHRPILANEWSADGFTALHFACFFGQPEAAKLLLQKGADPNAEARNPMKVTPLHSAAAARNLPIVTLLLSGGASPNVGQQGGWTPLHSAAQHGDKAMAELLLQHGAERHAKSEDGSMPKDLASKGGHTEVESLLA